MHINSLCGCSWRIHELCWERVGKQLVSHNESRNRPLVNLTTKPELTHTFTHNTPRVHPEVPPVNPPSSLLSDLNNLKKAVAFIVIIDDYVRDFRV